ncbi:MAG: methyltransferase domain-containing protein [Bacteroidota bacterium]
MAIMRNEDQIKFWDNEGGAFWAREADDLDVFLEPLSRAILDAAQLTPEDRVLDIGCGPGALALAAVKEAKAVLGVDLSSSLISLAQSRAETQGVNDAEFVVADAAVYQPAHPANVILSRVGIMFFDQPVEAFAKIRQDAAPGARLSFASWGPYNENPWIVEALEKIKPLLLTPPPERDPNAPGPFSLSQADRVQSILAEAGWKDIVVTPWVEALGAPANTPEATAAFLAKICPPARMAANQGVEPEKIVAQLTALYQAKQKQEGAIMIKGNALIVTAKA